MQEGVCWLIDPAGARFLSKGINTVRIDQDSIQDGNRVPYAEACRRKYASKAAWQAVVADRIAGWGFNTLGAWSDVAVATTGSAPLALTPLLDLGMSFAWGKGEGGKQQEFPDVFDPAFDRHVRDRAQACCGPRRDDPAVIGWFIDNELRWGPDWRGPEELLTIFVSMPPASPGRLAALRWLRERHRDFQDFNRIWHAPAGSWKELVLLPHIEAPYRRKPTYRRNPEDEEAANRLDPGRAAFTADCDAFAGFVAQRYFTLTCAAIKAADPHHLVLGCRFAFVPLPAVMDAAARHVDVISFNCYGVDPGKTIEAFRRTGKPCLIGEFSFRAADSGLPNTNGAGPLLATQARRAEFFRHYVRAAVRSPALVGYHWFEHADQPAEGRFDGENSNFGAVDIMDEVYEELTRAMQEVNHEADARHAASARPSQLRLEGAR